MKLDELTIGDLRQLQALIGGNPATTLNLPGLRSLVGKRVALFCLNYIYAGTLESVEGGEAVLSDGGIVYETGAFSDGGWADFQEYGKTLHVPLGMIEAYGEGK